MFKNFWKIITRLDLVKRSFTCLLLNNFVTLCCPLSMDSWLAGVSSEVRKRWRLSEKGNYAKQCFEKPFDRVAHTRKGKDWTKDLKNWYENSGDCTWCRTRPGFALLETVRTSFLIKIPFFVYFFLFVLPFWSVWIVTILEPGLLSVPSAWGASCDAGSPLAPVA